MPLQKTITNKEENAGHKQAIRRENEQQILNAAERVFAEFGFKGSTTAKIAQEAKIPKANLHYYFPTKEKLYRRVIEDICDSWLHSADLFDQSNDPREALTGYIHAKMDLSRQRPLGSRIWANEMIRGAQFTSDYIGKNVKEWLESRIIVIDKWINEEKIARVDPRSLMYMIWATTQHYADFNAQIEILNDNKSLTDEEFETAKSQVTEIILRGVGL
ncbi:TetR/AcrR family transcriptional regulator [Curvivirga aplysinae]|uniref:TetR/AcrR family transcriptional regulator n=1 Tax=Curvivirga aplysinae TaxID=2529852 RepID=UPI0012BB9762|nr:TetR/AcrR family transcriptional regulator [Curvivirga aplysinae]MTI09437.1 TetR/AcrR family transcriptional regulator [Curvivirga aplysinae]